MIAIKDAKWEVEINSSLDGIEAYIFTKDDTLFSNFMINDFKDEEDCKFYWEAFAKLNGITKWSYKT